jgi:hypothetical protein
MHKEKKSIDPKAIATKKLQEHAEELRQRSKKPSSHEKFKRIVGGSSDKERKA